MSSSSSSSSAEQLSQLLCSLTGGVCFSAASSSSSPSSDELLGALHLVSKLRQDDAVVRRDLETRLQQQAVELEAVQLRLARCEKRASDAEHESDQLRARLSSSDAALRTTSIALKETKAELQKTVVKSQSRQAQYVVEQRKREREFNKLQDRLSKSVGGAKSGVRILNGGKPKVGAIASSSSFGDQENDASRMLQLDFEERENVFLTENMSLRQSLLALQRQLTSIIDADVAEQQQQQQQQQQDIDAAVNADAPATEQEVMHLRMPFELVKESITGQTTTLLARVQSHVQEMRDELATRHAAPVQVVTQSPPDMKRLRDVEVAYQARVAQLEAHSRELSLQIDEQQGVIAEQERLLHLALEAPLSTAHTGSEPFRGIDVTDEITSLDLAEQRASIDRQRQQLEEDRRALLAAAIELGQQREQLQVDQSNSDSNRRAAEAMRVLQTLPPTPDWLRRAASPSMLLYKSRTPAGKTPTAALPPRSQFVAPMPLRYDDEKQPRIGRTAGGDDDS